MKKNEDRESQEGRTRQQGKHQGEREGRGVPTTSDESRSRDGGHFRAGNTGHDTSNTNGERTECGGDSTESCNSLPGRDKD